MLFGTAVATTYLQDVMQVFVLSNRGEVIENGLELVFLHPIANHYQLLHEQEHERADRQDLRV